MGKTILANVGGFTPVIDSLAREHGLIRAAVFGRIWRYCQLEDSVCRASLETISSDLGIDKATVMRHAAALVDDGYLQDLTPDIRNRPHVYKDTGKAGISITITAGSVAQSNVTVAECNTGVAESKLSKVFKRQRNPRSNERHEPEPLAPYAGYLDHA